MRLRTCRWLVLIVMALGILLLCFSGTLAEEDAVSSPEITERRTANPPGLGNPEVHQVAVNVYAVTGLYHPAGDDVGVSAGIIFTDNSIIFIDAGMSIASGEFLWQLAEEMKAGDEDLYLILTHRHSDHVFGMRVIRERGAKVIAHRILKDWFEQMGDRYKQLIVSKMGWDAEKGDLMLGEVLLFPPDQVIEHDTVLILDGEEIHILATPGHLYDQLSVYHPKSKTLFAGDAVYQGIPPHTGFGGPGEWKLWISQLERLKQLEIDRVVPGHGRLCSKKELDRNIAHLRQEVSKTK